MNGRKIFQTIGCILLLSLTVSWYGSNTMPPENRGEKLQTSETPLFLAHYMAWYQAPSVTGYWGWHWTMDHFNPALEDENGRPQIASHYTPLTGAYDSSDTAVLEYQVLLMKMSGIDGVIVDWYGNHDFRDYAAINWATNQLFPFVQKAGLTFVICYEDQSILHMVEENVIDREEGLERGQTVMDYMQSQWFEDEAYLTVDDRPVLFIFGPQHFKSSTDWEVLFSDLDQSPALVTLDNHRVLDAVGSYPWPPMQGGVTFNQPAIEAYLTQFYRRAQREEYVVGGAFPGFHDIYAEAEVRQSYGYLDAENGDTFRFTLQMAIDQNPDIIQLITWNDYGEGTMIEPTEEFGYRYLEILQEARHAMDENDLVYSAEDLTLPLQLFELRKQYANDDEVNVALDGVFTAIVEGDIETAQQIIQEYQ